MSSTEAGFAGAVHWDGGHHWQKFYFYFSFHFWPMEAVPQPGEGVAGSQVATKGMRKGKVHKDVYLALWNYLKVTQLPLMVVVIIQQTPLD